MQDFTKSCLEKELEAALVREAQLRAETHALRLQAVETQRQLVQAKKMASLGKMTAGIAHEIKNPLNFVVNFSHLSQGLLQDLKALLDAEHNPLDAESRDEIEDLLNMLTLNTKRINEHSLRADNIVRSMMEHSHASENALVDTVLSDVLDESVDFAYNAFKREHDGIVRDIHIIKEMDPAVGTVKLMPQDFLRVIINILDNAFHAVVDASASRDDAYVPLVKLSARRETGGVVVMIEDNGPGMSEGVKSKIFDPFFTTKPTGAGNTGLGLPLSYDIIAQGHNGSLEVKSDPGAGATFVIRLPG